MGLQVKAQENLLASRRYFLSTNFIPIAPVHNLLQFFIARNLNLINGHIIFARIDNRNQLPMHHNIRVSPDGRCKMGINWHVEGIVQPL